MNKKLNIAVVGAAGFGSYHLKAIFENPNANLVAICDINEEAAKKYSEMYGTSYTTSFDEILANYEITAISIPK